MMTTTGPGRTVAAMVTLIVLVSSVGAWGQTDDDDASVRTPRPPRTPDVMEEPEPSASAQAPVPSAKATRARTSVPLGTPRVATPPPKQVGVHRMGPKTRPAIALTLDDGWNANDEVLEMVDSLGLRGTAFLVGTVADTMPALPRRLARLGWEVCSHTYTHRLLTGLSESQIESEILKGARAVEKASGQRCRYFRPPGGATNSKVVGVARRLGFTVVNWNASISDTTTADTDPALQVEIALRDIEPGAILLGHFGGTHTVPVLREVLSLSLAAGYRVGTVSELFDGTTPPPATVIRPRGTPLPPTDFAAAPAEGIDDPWVQVRNGTGGGRESTPLSVALLILPVAIAGVLLSALPPRPRVRRKRTPWEASAPPPRPRAKAGR